MNLMDEERLQAYISLIQELLNCPSGEEAEILNRHPELIDEGLVQVCRQVVENLQREGQENQAQFLQHLAQQLAELLNLQSPGGGVAPKKATPEEYLRFLMEVLQAEVDSNSDPGVVYPLLAKNQDKLDLTFAEVLKEWFESKLDPDNSERNQFLAQILNDFAVNIFNFPLGNGANNLEIAIASYKEVLQVLTLEAFPQDWAMTQNNLGLAYGNRIRGERSENLEIAIAFYQEALQVYTCEVFPQDWAMTQNNLGNAYSERIRGEGSENLEKAIACYKAALQIRTREVFPQDWAMTQNNLGEAYRTRIRGERSENVEKAIAFYQEALQIRTREAFPQDWALTQNNLGMAYNDRIRGEHSENVEKAIACYEAALQIRTREAFPQDWAMTQNNLGIVYNDRIRGERSENVEKAIACYEAALQVYTLEAFPQDWAMTQNNLGQAYRTRIRGEHSENVEKAIACYEAALQVYTLEAFPQNWAATQNNLGISYNDRIRGERSENVEMAITCYEAALQVRTREAFPQEWAMAQNNLGIAYSNRIKGEQSENIEIAIAYYEAALQVRTREAFPLDWATTQNNLGNAYNDRIQGERSENVEMAIAYHKAVLQVRRTRETFPQEWARTQNNLGNTYRNRIQGERSENVEMAIAYYKAALQVRTRETFPQEWATTQNNLGIAYWNRIKGEKSENMERAIACYKAALQVRTREAFPQEWARTQNNLGLAYSDCIQGDRSENIEIAITYYETALQVLTLDAFPQEWATTQNNLGNAYENRIQGEQWENMEQAIDCYQAALQVHTPDFFPLDCLRTGRNLGNLGIDMENWEIAISGYNQAILGVEKSRYWAVSELTKREIIENNLIIYEKMVQACIKHQDYRQAILTVERSKSQTLIELLNSANLYPKNATDDQKQSISELRRQIASYQQQLMDSRQQATGNRQELIGGGLAEERGENFSYVPEANIRTQLQTANQEFQQLLEEIGDSDFALTQQVTPQLPDFRHLLNSETAILEWYLPANNESNFYLFLITPTPDKNFQIHHLTFTPEDHQQLQEAIRDYRSDYGETTWETQLEKYLQILSQALQLPKILLQLTNYQRLILIPHRELHLIPFHALPISESESQLLGDKFLVQYSPSCQIFNNLSQRPPLDPHSPPFFAIQNPTQDLTYADLEVEQLCRQFDPQQILVLPHDKATKTALNQQKTRNFLGQTTYIHFSCHGEFDEEFPRNSYLRLANREKLTFLDIFENLDIPNCRLLILSACKMGLVETPPTDDYVGLASAFFYAGTRTVVGSLWEADDLATALLMIRLYLELPKFGSVVEALREAQSWLRNVSCEEVLAWLRGGLKLSEDSLEECELYLELYDDDRPFANPIYWSAFTAIGI
ncbi:hypothetical protein CYANOKiyG1_54160 [Okeania sp. KiyG1]|nr:CHAT domain-containing protein [Okeania sp. KiyG1]GGA36329.1 hypothetical protein CYANOKiyG1_54160 [Okeania sp. KiyG1]